MLLSQGLLLRSKLPQCLRIREIDVTRNQHLKGALGLAGRVFPHQFHVIIHQIHGRGDQKETILNQKFPKQPDGIPAVAFTLEPLRIMPGSRITGHRGCRDNTTDGCGWYLPRPYTIHWS